MNDLLAVSYDSGAPTVSGRELHEKLGIRTRYNDWFPRMAKYGFEEGKDYILFTQKCSTYNPKNPWTTVIDHQITLPMAKQICMIQRSEAGRKYRKYFLEIESAWNSPDAVMERAMRIANEHLALLKGDMT